jgi:hypothetical protein
MCAECGRGVMYRSDRRSFLDRYIYPLVGLYPWRCKFCRNRERLRDRGSRSSAPSERRRSSLHENKESSTEHESV